jgi:hypothetical protein
MYCADIVHHTCSTSTYLYTRKQRRKKEKGEREKLIYKQEVLGRTNRLLSFDTKRTAHKNKKLEGGDTAR